MQNISKIGVTFVDVLIINLSFVLSIDIRNETHFRVI